MTATIWTLTLNPAIDMEGLVEELQPEIKLRSSRPRLQAGGGGVNVARVLARLGVRATAIFPCGGALGKFFRDLLEQESVACETVNLEGAPRINTHIRVKEDNSQYRFCMPGPEMDSDDEQRILDRVRNVLGKDDTLICSGSLPRGVEAGFNTVLADAVQEVGARLILDAPGDVIREAGRVPADWLKPNRRELETALGREVNMEAVEEELDAFREQTGAKHILLSLGDEGAVYGGEEGCLRVSSPEVKKVSSVGAGDSAIAGLAFALSESRPVKEAVRWATVAGAAAVMTPGSNLMENDDFKRLLKESWSG